MRSLKSGLSIFWHASVVGGNNSRIEKSLLETVNDWRFLLKVVDGKCVDAKVTVAVDLSHWKTWANEAVRLTPPTAAAQPANPWDTLSDRAVNRAR